MSFSDNILRNLLLSMIVGMGMGIGRQERETFVSMVTFIFSVPFLLLSMPGGWLADRFSKRQVTIWTKVMEFGSMVLATAGLATHSLSICLAALTLVASQAALFGPSKYGLLPELLPEKSLSWGNGVIELGTFLAIIVGTVAGAGMAEGFPRARGVRRVVLFLALACIGFFTSLGIDKVPAAAPHKPFRANVLKDLYLQIRIMHKDRPLFLAVLGNTYFWFLGSLLFSTIVVYGPDVLHVGQTRTGYLNATLAVGIGIGSMAAGWLSDNKIEYGLIPLGSIGMTCTGLVLGVYPHGLHRICRAPWHPRFLRWLLRGAGQCAHSASPFIQRKGWNHRRCRTCCRSLASLSPLWAYIKVFTSYIHLDPRGVIVASSLITAAGTVYVLVLLPEWFARLILFFVTHILYRIQVAGRDNFPEKSGALLVCNHMSFVDAALLVAATDRPIRFVMYQGIYDHPLVKPLAVIGKAIPISSEQRPRELIRSLQVASQALRDGEIVCIFAEGQITRTGQLLPFRRGLEHVMKDVDTPIIPVNLDGVWGSTLQLRARTVPVEAAPADGPQDHREFRQADAADLQRHRGTERRFRKLHSEAFNRRKQFMQTLDHAFVGTARRFRRRFMMADGNTPRVSFGAALTRTLYIAARLRTQIGQWPMIGVLLPPSVGGALTNYALMLLGRIPVNFELHIVRRGSRVVRGAMRPG